MCLTMIYTNIYPSPQNDNPCEYIKNITSPLVIFVIHRIVLERTTCCFL